MKTVGEDRLWMNPGWKKIKKRSSLYLRDYESDIHETGMVGSWYVLVMCEKELLLWTILLASNGWKTTKFDLIDYPCPPPGLSVCLFVCPHRTFVFFSATVCRIETKFSPLVRLLMWNVFMIIMMSLVTWCGSHIGKMEKLWTSVSLKLHQRKIETWHRTSTLRGEWVIFYVICAIIMMS